jgi:hypothetical protein
MLDDQDQDSAETTAPWVSLTLTFGVEAGVRYCIT